MSEKSIQEYYTGLGAHCYGCGRLNDHGLHIRSFLDGDETVCRFEPKPYHSAFPGYVYGGLLASLVDCHGTGSAAIFAYRRGGQALGDGPEHRFVTASLLVNYRKPTPICELEIRGRAKEIKGRKTVVTIEIRANDEVCVEGEVVAIEVDDRFLDSVDPKKS